MCFYISKDNSILRMSSRVPVITMLIPKESTHTIKEHRLSRTYYSNYQVGEPTRSVCDSGHRVLFGDLASFSILDYILYAFTQQTTMN